MEDQPLRAQAGAPISYLLLERGTPVFAEGGVAVGRVWRVLSAAPQDVFHGLVINSHHGSRLVNADQVDSLYERAVLLSLSEAACRALPTADEDPAAAPDGALHGLEDLALHVWQRLSGRGG